MNEQHQFAEDLSLYALGELQYEQRARVEDHLDGCAACRRELEYLRGDLALLALSAAGPKPPTRARARFVEAMAREPRRNSLRRSTPWWVLVPSFAAAALAVVAIFFWARSMQLEEELAKLQKQSAQSFAELQKAREVMAPLTASDAMRVTLVAAKQKPEPQGKAIYVRDRSSLIFLANNMPSLPPQKAYELWLIPVAGAPIPAGVFKPDMHGSAIVINPPLPANTEARAFAITVEPESGSNAPTSPIVMMGAGE